MILYSVKINRLVLLYGLMLVLSQLFWVCQPKGHSLPPGDPDNGGLYLPEGFTALVVVDSIGPARHLAVKDNGDIYVKLRYSPDHQGGNVALRDGDGNGKVDVVEYFGEYQDHGALANGMTIHGDYLYFSSSLEIFRQKLDTALIPAQPAERILVDDHAHGTHWHITKPMAFDSQGNMYVPFGAPSNACMDIENTPAGIPGLPGKDPCPELEDHGGIWRFKSDVRDQIQSQGEKVSTGIRSVVAMSWNPQDDQIYAVVHGRDDLHMLFPHLYSRWQSAVLPAEEFIRVSPSSDFGWPYCYFDQLQGKKVLAPEYGGDGNIQGRCEDCDLPLMGFPGHWAPNDLHFYQGDLFPARYRNGAFIAFHGSTNRTPYPQSGYFVAFVPFIDGQPGEDWEVFADGFAQVDPIVNTGDARYRPMGLATGPDGSLYVTDSRQGKIWRIMYTGDPENFDEEQLVEFQKRKELSHLRNPHPIEDNLQKDSLGLGAQLYRDYCMSCHQSDGKGAGSRFPSLVNTPWVNGDPQQLIAIILEGMQGEIQVQDKYYNGVMPAFPFLTTEETAALLTYVRESFGHNADPITMEQVQQYLNSQTP